MSKPNVIDAMQRMNGDGLGLFSSRTLPVITAQLVQLGEADTKTEQDAANDRAAEIASAYGYATTSRDKPFIFYDGVAIIPIQGCLLNRFSYSWGFVTGYNCIRGLVNAAVDDEDVKLIVYDVNSGGGEAAGCFELGNELREIRGTKPTLAVIDSLCCSAAYGLASAADRIVCIPSGTVGSIGVIAMHMNMQKYYENLGIDITLVAEGPQKTAGNPYEPLSTEALADIQKRVGQRMDQFIALVVANRGSKGLDEAAIRATESRSYLAQDALDLKLIDAVQTPSEAVSSFLAELGSCDSDEDDEDDEAMAALTEAEQTAAIAAARDEGATAERQRQTDIMALPEAASRPKAARHLAMTSGAPVKDIQAMLAGLDEEPKAAAPAEQGKAKEGEGALDKLMDQTGGGAGVKPNAGEDGGDQSGKPSRGARALASTFGPAKAPK